MAPLEVREYFSTVSRSTFSLFQIVTLDTWASQIMRPVMEVYPIMIIFFMILAAVAAPALVWCAVLMVRWARHQPS